MTDSLTGMAGHCTPPLIVRRPATDTTGRMVRFVNPRSRARGLLTVRRARSRSGYRLVVTYPDGLRRLHTFPDHAALIAGTSALQAELTRAGWEPLHRPVPRWRPSTHGPESAPWQSAP